MKILLRALVVFVLSVVIASVYEYRPNASLLNTVFTVSGIMFSVGLGLIVSFSPDGVRNSSYLQRIRKNINNVKNSFFVEFFIVVLCYVLSTLPLPLNGIIFIWKIKINLPLFFSIQILLSIFYFAINFLSIQKLKNELFDRVLGEKDKQN